jgi:hypothetical protein
VGGQHAGGELDTVATPLRGVSWADSTPEASATLSPHLSEVFCGGQHAGGEIDIVDTPLRGVSWADSTPEASSTLSPQLSEV